MALVKNFRENRDQREGSGDATDPSVIISGGPTYERAILELCLSNKNWSWVPSGDP